MQREQVVSFDHQGKHYTARGWYSDAHQRFLVTSVIVHFEARDRSGFPRRRTRYVYRGLEGQTKLQRTLVLIAASLLTDRRIGEREAA